MTSRAALTLDGTRDTMAIRLVYDTNLPFDSYSDRTGNTLHFVTGKREENTNLNNKHII